MAEDRRLPTESHQIVTGTHIAHLSKEVKLLTENWVVEPYEIQIIASVKATNYPIRIGESLPLTLQFRNAGREAIPAGLEILIIENSYFYYFPVLFDDVVPRGRTSVEQTVEIPAKGVKNFSLLPEVLQISVSHPKCSVICRDNAIKLYSDLFILDLIEGIKPPYDKIPFFNILCFGIAGSGKSSFINSVMTALSQEVTSPAAVGGTTNHVTTDLTRFQLSQINNLEKIPINFFDIWGMDGNNYQNNMFLHVLHGKLPEGYEMRERITQREEMNIAEWSVAERRIHSVLFFMPYNVQNNPKFTRAPPNNLDGIDQDPS